MERQTPTERRMPREDRQTGKMAMYRRHRLEFIWLQVTERQGQLANTTSWGKDMEQILPVTL